MTVTEQEIELAVAKARRAALGVVQQRGCYHFADEIEAAAVASVAWSLRSFDSELGVPFPLYAARRAFGAGLDVNRAWRGRYYQKLEARGGDTSLSDGSGGSTTFEPEPFGENQEPDPLDVVEHRDRLEEVVNLIRALPDGYRQAMELVTLRGLTMAAAGEILGVTESRICQRVSWARHTLRDQVAALDGD